MSNSLDPDQARHYVGLDLGPNCLQRLSADNKMSGWLLTLVFMFFTLILGDDFFIFNFSKM